MADKKIFVSYDYDNDKHYRHLLSAWDANKEFDFTFEDHSTPEINTEDAGRIKAAISAKMKNANCLLVIVGKDTAGCEWVTWEIEKAKELGLGLVGVKVDDEYTSPSALLGAGASWAMSFTESAIASPSATASGGSGRADETPGLLEFPGRGRPLRGSA